MPYTTYIQGLAPDHYWPLDGASTNVGSVALTTQTPAGYIAGDPITVGKTNSALFNGTNSLDYGDSSLNVGGPWVTRSYTMWGTFTDRLRDSLCANAGASVRNISMYFALGGVPAYLFSNDADSNPGQPWSQAIFGPALKTDTPYHMGMVWQSLGAGTVGGGSYMRAYLNGVLLEEKLIFQNNTNLAGGQMNAHSGNIELGLGQTIIVSGQTFNVSDHVGRLADVAVWDGVVLDDATMLELYTRGALPTDADLTLTDVPAGTEVRAWELDALGGSIVQEFSGGVEESAGGTETITYQAAVEVPARIALVNLDRRVFYTDRLLPREGLTLPANLLLRSDIVYVNPDSAVEPPVGTDPGSTGAAHWIDAADLPGAWADLAFKGSDTTPGPMIVESDTATYPSAGNAPFGSFATNSVFLTGASATVDRVITSTSPLPDTGLGWALAWVSELTDAGGVFRGLVSFESGGLSIEGSGGAFASVDFGTGGLFTFQPAPTSRLLISAPAGSVPRIWLDGTEIVDTTPSNVSAFPTGPSSTFPGGHVNVGYGLSTGTATPQNFSQLAIWNVDLTSAQWDAMATWASGISIV